MGRIIRTIAILIVAGLLVGLIMFNASSKPDLAEQVWDQRTTVGSLEAKNYYVMYTDLACPYCDVFSRQLMWHDDEFQRDYIAGKDILYEVRLTDFLFEYGEHQPEMSRWSAEAAYCARNEDKFWDYYHASLQALWDDYHSKGIGVSKTSPEITGMTLDYWLDLGRGIGLGEEFEACVRGHKTLAEIKENTEKASRAVGQGLPYFKFNKFTSGGFDQSWGWDYVKQYLDAGLSQS